MFFAESQIETIYDQLQNAHLMATAEIGVKISNKLYRHDPNRARREAWFKRSIESGLSAWEMRERAISEGITTANDFYSKLNFYELKYGKARRGYNERATRIGQKVEDK
jgi:hypothetical protein